MTTTENKRSIPTKSGEVVEVPENHIVRIVDGIVGFPDFEQYALIPHGPDSPFLWLQSVDRPSLAFLTIDPRLFVPDYTPTVSRAELDLIELESLEKAIVQVVVVVPENPTEMTANLMGPVLINAGRRLARQMISQSPHHKIRHRILDTEPAREGGGR